MTSKKRVRKLFSVDDLRQEVAKESSLQQLLANFIAFPAENAPESNPRTLEAWLVARYGLLATVEVLSFTRSTMSLPVNEQQRLLATFHPHVDGKHFHVLHRVARTSPAVLKSCQTSVLTPPTSSCLLCPNSPHLSVHHKCNVVVHGFGGARQATKISTRCHRCRNIYNYTSFGNTGDGWTLYQEARDLVEASDACFVERPMFELQCSLANHCWVSFSGWSVAYNEAFGLLSNSLEVSEKQVAATFWNGELEIEVRGTGQLDFYGLFHKNDDREAVMEEIERRRSQSVYVHSSEDCSQDCKKRGCGRLWVADGLWKIMFPHCAMSTKVDSTKETPLCAKQNIRAYPRLKLYYDQGEIKRYNGKRRMNDLKALVDKFAGTSEKESESADTAEADNGLYTLTSENFDKHVEIGLHFIKFYVPWCSHCRKLAPTWKALAEYHKDNMDITIAKIDCTTEGKKCTEHKIHAFPSLKLFKDGREVDSYEGSRSLDDLKNYLTLKISEHSLLSSATTENSETAEEIPSDELDLQIKPFQLTDSNFDAMISFGTTFVKFYAPWCGHCRELAPVWDQLANKCADSSSGPRIAKVDCTTKEELCSSMGVYMRQLTTWTFPGL